MLEHNFIYSCILYVILFSLQDYVKIFIKSIRFNAIINYCQKNACLLIQHFLN